MLQALQNDTDALLQRPLGIVALLYSTARRTSGLSSRTNTTFAAPRRRHGQPQLPVSVRIALCAPSECSCGLNSINRRYCAGPMNRFVGVSPDLPTGHRNVRRLGEDQSCEEFLPAQVVYKLPMTTRDQHGAIGPYGSPISPGHARMQGRSLGRL